MKNSLGLWLLFVLSPAALPAAAIELTVCTASSCLSHSTPGTLTYPRTGPGWASTGEARSTDYGEMGVFAAVNTSSVDVVTHANVTLSDRLFLTGLSGGSVDFHYSVSASASYLQNATGLILYLRQGTVTSVLVPSVTLYAAGTQVVAPVPLVSDVTMTKAFSSGVLDYTFTLTAAINCGSPCSAEIDALNTLRLTGLVFRDASGAVVANPGITAESGFDYTRFLTAGGSAVPEPSTAGYLAIAAAMGIVVRRMRTRYTPSNMPSNNADVR